MVRAGMQGQPDRRRGPTWRRLVTRLLINTGLVRTWKAVARRRVPLIVSFHDVTPDTGRALIPPDPMLRMEPTLFGWVVTRLAQHFRFASLDEIVASRDRGLVAVTFDEGYRGVYQHAFPVLKKYNIPATVFLVTRHVGTDRLLWWDRLRLQTRKVQESGAEAAHRLGALEPQILGRDGKIDEDEIVRAFKKMSRSQQDETWRVLDDLAGPATSPERIFLSEQEIREMAAAGIQFGAHTRTHPLLTWLDDAELLDEVAGSKADVARLIGTEDIWFAYPDGVFGDREMALVRETGFRGAVQTWRYPWKNGRYAAPRIDLNASNLCGGSAQPDATRLEIVLAGLSTWAIRCFWRGGLGRGDWGAKWGA